MRGQRESEVERTELAPFPSRKGKERKEEARRCIRACLDLYPYWLSKYNNSNNSNRFQIYTGKLNLIFFTAVRWKMRWAMQLSGIWLYLPGSRSQIWSGSLSGAGNTVWVYNQPYTWWNIYRMTGLKCHKDRYKHPILIKFHDYVLYTSLLTKHLPGGRFQNISSVIMFCNF